MMDDALYFASKSHSFTAIISLDVFIYNSDCVETVIYT